MYVCKNLFVAPYSRMKQPLKLIKMFQKLVRVANKGKWLPICSKGKGTSVKLHLTWYACSQTSSFCQIEEYFSLDRGLGQCRLSLALASNWRTPVKEESGKRGCRWRMKKEGGRLVLKTLSKQLHNQPARDLQLVPQPTRVLCGLRSEACLAPHNTDPWLVDNLFRWPTLF